MTQESDDSEVAKDLIFHAGRFAEARGLPEPRVLQPGDTSRQTPGGGDLLIIAPRGAMTVEDARDAAALLASGRGIFVITREPLEPAVQAWLPKECVHMVGEADQPSWRVGHGLLALTHDESAETWIYDAIQNGGMSETQALSLADQMDRVTPRIAWDRPILVNDYRCWDYVVNRAGTYLGARIRGLSPSDLIPAEAEAPWTYFSRNPLCIVSGTGYERAIMTINVILDHHPFLLVCVNNWDVQDHWDRSYCLPPEQSLINDSDLAWKQARSGGKPDKLEPAPAWFQSLGTEAVDFLCDGLMGGWASGFLNGIIAGGVDWLCAHGKGLDEALQVDWATAIRVLREGSD